MEYIFLSYAQPDAVVGQRLKKDLLQTGRTIRTDEPYTPGSDEWRQYIAANAPGAACVVMIPTLSMGLRAWLWIEELARLGPPILCVFRIEDDYIVIRSYQELRADTARASTTTVVGDGLTYEKGFKELLERIYATLAGRMETNTIPRSLLDLANTDLEFDADEGGDELGGLDDTITLSRDRDKPTGGVEWAGSKAPSEMDIQSWLEALRERHMSRPQDIPTDSGFRTPDFDTGRQPQAGYRGGQEEKERKPDPPKPAEPPPPPAQASRPASPVTQPAAPPAARPQSPPRQPAPGGGGVMPDVTTDRIDYQQLQEELKAAATPQFTAFWPDLAQPSKSYPLVVYVHREDALDSVRIVARGFAAQMGGSQISGSGVSYAPVEMGSVLTLVPQMAGLTFDPPSATLVWNPFETYRSASFIFTIPADPLQSYSGWVLVYDGPVILGKIDVTIRVPHSMPRTVPAGDTRSTSGEGQLEPLEVFASYSHRDTPVVEYFRRLREDSGQKLLVDVYDLRAGEEWNQRLLQLIDGAEVFQLFWSKRSARSEFVEQEWRHALQFTKHRPRFIQPVFWEEPLESPPNELSHLHFQRVDLPIGTQAQMTLNRLRNFINRKR